MSKPAGLRKTGTEVWRKYFDVPQLNKRCEISRLGAGVVHVPQHHSVQEPRVEGERGTGRGCSGSKERNLVLKKMGNNWKEKNETV